MMPGIRASPPASIVSRAAPSTSPSAAMRPSATASAPTCGAEPRPSSSVALRIRRSYTSAEYTGARMEIFRLKGKVAVVTGGASGIGAATVELLGQCGAKVTVLDIASGTDVTDTQAVERAFAKLGAFDILVNS